MGAEAVQHHHRQQDNHSKYSRIPARPRQEQQEPTTTAISELQQFQHQLKTIRLDAHTKGTADGNGGHKSNLNHTRPFFHSKD
ncbi:hypothetical protein Nepgr_020405 [Nepenthes gracilis]|uniref:Uncharacterized protein n=1 Tax=Nepenthes gracilis TaxID=150966 RepID=A0AAD3SWW6_NEPGR|nr:hypothetical protein Nepgr_020405 [Nepenthes gracilis]